LTKPNSVAEVNLDKPNL